VLNASEINLIVCISQGKLATRLRCSGKCDKCFVAQWLPSPAEKALRKSVKTCWSY